MQPPCLLFLILVSVLWAADCKAVTGSSSGGVHAVRLASSRDAKERTSEQIQAGRGRASPVAHAAREGDANATVDTPKSPLSGYTNLRIGHFIDALSDTEKYCTKVGELRPTFQGGTAVCTFDDILTEEKRKALTDEILPFAIEMHTSRLMVIPATGTAVVPEAELATPCNEFSIPDSHKTEGVKEYDFLLYVAAAPTTDGSTAWATHCATALNGRPSAGVGNISPRYIYPWNTEFTGRVLAHEIGHALGFTSSFFEAKGMTATAANIRGKPNDVLVLISPQVVKAGRMFFGWEDLEYVELEDEGGPALEGSHWKRRNLKDDLMSGISGANKYSILTLAAFEDLGFYRANYSNAEFPVWGYQGGENLLTKKCLVNGVSQDISLFCTKSDEYLCTADRLAYGKCGVASYDVMFPFYSRYFSDPYEGGTLLLMDYCPSVQSFANTGCRDGTQALMPGSVISPTSLCLEGNSDIEFNGHTPSTICAPVQCNSELQTYSIKVQGSSKYVECPEGKTLNLTDYSHEFTAGSVTCPPYTSMCHDEVNATSLEKPMCLCKNLKKKMTRASSSAETAVMTSKISDSTEEKKENSFSTSERRRGRKRKRFLVKNGRIVRSLRRGSD